MKRLVILATMGLFIIAATALGCDSEDETLYSAQINWKINGLQKCEALLDDHMIAGDESDTDTEAQDSGADKLVFDEIQIKLFDNEGDEEPIEVFNSISCASNSYTLQGMKAGSYHLWIGAIATYDGIELPFYQAEGPIKIPAAEGVVTELNLTMAKGKVRVTWGFEMGMCGGYDIDHVSITLDPEHSNPIVESDVACEDGAMEIGGLDWDFYTLSVIGYDKDGTELMSGQADAPFWIHAGEFVDEHEMDKAYVKLTE